MALTGLLDWGIRCYEEHANSPAVIRWGAGFATRWLVKPGGTRLAGGIQDARLRRTVAYVYRHSPFYRRMFERLGLKPGDIGGVKDLRGLPFTTPADLRNWQEFLCVPPEQVAAVFTTSGTTGEPKRVYFTLRDLNVYANFAATVLRMTFRGRLTALLALPFGGGMWIGPGSSQRMIERAGGLPLPLGSGDPHGLLAWMRRFEPNLIISSPTYMTTLTRAAEREGYRQAVEQILVGGEPLYAEQRDYISAYWGAPVVNGYGATELGGAQTMAFAGGSGLALNDFHMVTEIVDPVSGEAAQEGELVFTTLRREGMPLLRYRIGDRARWVPSAPGLPVGSIELLQRSDDFIIAGDMGLYGSVMVEALQAVEGFGGKAAFELDRVNLTDRMRLKVEGQKVNPDRVRQVLFELYPELPGNVANGNLLLEIETGADLSQQVKALRITDARKTG